MPNYPRFEQRVKDQIVSPAFQQQAGPGYGIVMEYDPIDNTATVLMAQPGSDQVGKFYTGVPCPTQIGVQNTAPEPGRPCWVVFRDGATMGNPMITHYFNHVYQSVDYRRQNFAENDLPRFMTET